MKFIDSTKVSTTKRITVTKAVQEIIGMVDDGDVIMFYLDDNRNVVLKKA